MDRSNDPCCAVLKIGKSYGIGTRPNLNRQSGQGVPLIMPFPLQVGHFLTTPLFWHKPQPYSYLFIPTHMVFLHEPLQSGHCIVEFFMERILPWKSSRKIQSLTD